MCITLGEYLMLIASILAAFLVLLSTFTHYEVLRALSAIVSRIRIQPRARLLVVLFGTFFGHLLGISFYAMAYYFANKCPKNVPNNTTSNRARGWMRIRDTMADNARRTS